MSETLDAYGPMDAALIRCGGDLVLLAERTYGRLMQVAIGSVAAAAIVSAALALAAPDGVRLPLTLLLSALVLLSATAGLVAADHVYRWARRSRGRHALPAAAGMALLVVDGPGGPLWFVAMGLLTITAVVAETRFTLILAAGCTLAYALGTMLPERSALPGGDGLYLAAALGFIVNGALARGMIEWLARFMLELRRLQPAAGPPPHPPLRVAAVQDSPATVAVTVQRARPIPLRLTARQLEVVLLLRDGLDQADVADALGISARQVERHVAQARQRTGSLTTAHLVAAFVAASSSA
jgi:DNA-binding CsgD family transcriptional regulator